MELSRLEIAATLFAYAVNALDSDNALVELDRAGTEQVPATAMTDGTGANQADVWFENQSGSLASGVSTDHNLNDGSGFTIPGTGLNIVGGPWLMAEVVALLVANDATSAGDLLVGGASLNQFDAWLNNDVTAKLRIRPGGFFFLFAPTDPAYTCASGDHLLKIEASGGAATYKIFGVGRSA